MSLPYVGAVQTLVRAAASHKQQCPAGSGREKEEEESTPWEGGEQREEEKEGFGRRKQVSGCLGLSFRAAALQRGEGGSPSTGWRGHRAARLLPLPV